MAVLFMDTSALVRRYDPREPGAARVRRLCRPASGHDLFICSITSVEIASAFNRKLREGLLDRQALQRMWRLFRAHRRHEYVTIMPRAPLYEHAALLLFWYPLRAYDAVQLASAQQLADEIAGSGAEFRFCTADRQQAQAAQGEGLKVEFIA